MRIFKPDEQVKAIDFIRDGGQALWCSGDGLGYVLDAHPCRLMTMAEKLALDQRLIECWMGAFRLRLETTEHFTRALLRGYNPSPLSKGLFDGVRKARRA